MPARPTAAQSRAAVRRGQGPDRRRLPLHRGDRGGAADPEGGEHSGDHGRRAHRQPDRPRDQDRLAGLPARAARRRRARRRRPPSRRACGSDELFAIIDDGTIYGRELAESFALAAEQAGLKPVFVDTFRPQLDNQIGLVGRLSKAGATHVFAGGDRDDIAIMGRDAGSA